MKRTPLAALVLAMIITISSVAPAFAQSADSLSDAQITRIKSNCRQALATLGQLHMQDAAIYINRNQTYFSISDKLMARLNGRLALNRYDASDLVSIANDYNIALGNFRSLHNDYDDAISSVLKIDCTRQPTNFYNSVVAAQAKRQKVHDAVVRLKQLIGSYDQGVSDFRQNHPLKSSGASS